MQRAKATPNDTQKKMLFSLFHKVTNYMESYFILEKNKWIGSQIIINNV